MFGVMEKETEHLDASSSLTHPTSSPHPRVKRDSGVSAEQALSLRLEV